VSPKSKKIFSVVFKIAILLLAFGFIFKKLHNNKNLNNFQTLAKGLNLDYLYLTLVGVFLLMLLNWFIESVKWRFLLRKIERITLHKALESVFCGLTLAIITPNRIGEYGGRVFFLSPRKRIFGVIAMAVGSVGQMVITNVLGAIAILLFVQRFFDLNIMLFYSLVFVVVGFICFFLFFYFNIRLLDYLLSKVKFLHAFKRYFHIFDKFRKTDLGLVLFYSLCRYIVFTSQYCLIIHLLVPEIPIADMIMMIFILFFIQSALPSLDLLDVGVRSMTATYFFAFITSQEVAIIASTTLIWLVNLIIPAIIGSVFVLKLNFFDKSNN
jgi:hypothetical protein